MRGPYFALSALVIAAVVADKSYSHHSAAMFDRDKEVTLQGTIKDILWVNPHSWIDIVVTDDKGNQIVWGIESITPSGFVRMGMTRDPPYPKPGDKVAMTVHPLRDGRPGGSFITMTLTDGKTFILGNPYGPAATPPAASAAEPETR